MGALDLNLMSLGGRPLAFAYNYCWNGHVFGLRAGYDPSVSRDGAGNLLYLHVLRDSFERGDRMCDMGPGSLECKRHFVTRTVPIYRYSHFPIAGARVQLVRLKRWAQQRLYEYGSGQRWLGPNDLGDLQGLALD
jgi:hypothetical protein